MAKDDLSKPRQELSAESAKTRKMSAAEQRIIFLRDHGLARTKSVESVNVLTNKASSVKVINMASKRVRAVTPTDRAEMVRLARDPNIRRDYPRLVLESLPAKPADGPPRHVISLISKRVRALPPTDRKAMEEAARDPTIQRQFPVLKLEEW